MADAMPDVLARDRMEQTRRCVRRLDEVKMALMLEGEEWKPAQVKAKAGKSDPTASKAIYRADELPVVMQNLKAEERELIAFIGCSLVLIEAVRVGLGEHYADVLDWMYVDCLSWSEIADLHGVSKSTGSEWRSIAIDWMDSVGIKNLLRGETEL